MTRKAKIVATIGPASQKEEILEKLIRAGMNVARMNFSHGTHEEHAERMALVRKVSERLGTPVGILQDLQGPKIRVGELPEIVQLSDGEMVTLYATGMTPPPSEGQQIPVDFRQLFDSVRTSDRLLLDDGRLTLEVISVRGHNALTARVIIGGSLSSHKGINLPGVRLRIAGFTEKDEADLEFGLSQGVDAVAISFVRTAEDVRKVRQALERLSNGRRLPLLIAKLEKPEALDNLDAILDIVDGVMVARGDLGVELPPERVPALQKHIIRTANRRAKLVITATQMLESMISNPLPTRAEASDVANAVFDGTDAVMLSAETASGKYPVESVQMMDRIVREAEVHFLEWGAEQSVSGFEQSDAASMSRAAQALASDKNVTAVACFTMQGQTAWLMSKIRPRVPVMAFTPDNDTYRRLTFLWGVRPQLVAFSNSLEEMIDHVEQALLESYVVKPGDQVVLVCGFPVGALRPPNMALLHTVGEG
ncbi:MAG TPA: pyruvate kinase [Anaerolineales bacterium]|nr:pyruvate kinase [Anaerolineales bacterium]